MELDGESKGAVKSLSSSAMAGIGATIMGIALFVGRLVTPYAETAFACPGSISADSTLAATLDAIFRYFKVHPLVGVGILAVLAGGLKVITSGPEAQ